MKEVKDIVGQVVRKVTKRILGENVPTAEKAEHSLLWHLIRIKRGLINAYVELEKKQQTQVLFQNSIDNLGDAIKEATIPYVKVKTDSGEELIASLGNLMFRDTSKIVEIYDTETDVNKLFRAWGNSTYRSIKSAFPNIQAITLAKKVGITRDYKDLNGNNYFNEGVIPSNCFIKVTLGITESTGGRSSGYFLAKDNMVEELHMPYFSYSSTYNTLVYNCSKLKVIDMPSYTADKGYSESIILCDALEELYFPKMKKIENGGRWIDRCSNLKRILVPNATHLGITYSGNYFIFKDSPLIEEMVLGSVKTIGRQKDVSNVNLDNLSKVEVGEGTIIFPAFVSWTATNVADDLLNSNFKTYFAERLATFTDGSVHTLTFCQSFYDRLTEENKTILANKGWTIAIAELE